MPRAAETDGGARSSFLTDRERLSFHLRDGWLLIPWGGLETLFSGASRRAGIRHRGPPPPRLIRPILNLQSDSSLEEEDTLGAQGEPGEMWTKKKKKRKEDKQGGLRK